MKIGEKKHLGAYDVVRMNKDTLRLTDTSGHDVAKSRMTLAVALGEHLMRAKVPVALKERVGDVSVDCLPSEAMSVLTTTVQNADACNPTRWFATPKVVTFNAELVEKDSRTKAVEQVEELGKEAFRVLNKLMNRAGFRLVHVNFTYGYSAVRGLMITSLIDCDTMYVVDGKGAVVKDDAALIEGLKRVSSQVAQAAA